MSEQNVPMLLVFLGEVKGDVVAIDCKTVTVTGGVNVCARCTIVNHQQKIIYDTYIKPDRKVTDYRTPLTGKFFSMSIFLVW